MQTSLSERIVEISKLSNNNNKSSSENVKREDIDSLFVELMMDELL
ncbi:13854_t:CDS:1 [Gigaspora rosea]|nr:13854_t:CDS:1 [Gigaspora rosea]